MAGEKTVNDVTFRIRHTMMLVSDLDRSIDFYTRLLGMDVQRIRPNPRNTSASAISVTAAKMNIPASSSSKPAGPDT
jgi:Lactoylglutathione lyase and related lyases